MNISQKIKILRNQLGLSQNEFANQLDTLPTTISKYERGEIKPSFDFLAKLGNKFNTNLNWLLTGEGEMFRNRKGDPMLSKRTEINQTKGEGNETEHSKKDGFVFIPLYDAKAAARAGYINSDENIEDFLAFKQSWIKNNLKSNIDDLFLIHVIGDSMEPTLKEGDIVLGDKGKINLKNGIYIIREDEELSIKRLQFKGNQITVISDNKIYPAYDKTNSDIIGKAVWFGRKI